MSTSDGQRLQRLFEQLPEEARRSLLDFAEFLAERGANEPLPTPEPEEIVRPADESVVAAMRRLSRSYHMLDKSKMLNETSTLMAQHVLQGRAAVEVIDELEQVFERHYQALREQQQ